MLLAICMLIGFCFFLLSMVWELKYKIKKMEEILKSMNHDLNMVSKTMDNMDKRQKSGDLKIVLKG